MKLTINPIFASLMLAVFLVGPALGQQDEADSRLELDEIVVTAQKQEQNIRDVPFSVTAISGDELREQGLEDLTDVSRLTPNVTINHEQNRAHIRGFGSINNQTIEQSVALVVDGVFYARPGYLRAAFLDLERFEVLRGPQGTLFGKNAVAGVLNFTTANPEADWGGNLKALAGEFDQLQFEGAITGPIIEDFLEFRLAGIHSERDGHIHNDFTGGSLNGIDHDGVRGKLKSHFGPHIDLTLSAEFTKSFSDGPAFQISVITPDAQPLYQTFDPDMDFVFNKNTSVDEPQFSIREAVSTYALAEANFLWGTKLSSLTSWARADDDITYDGDGGPSPFIVLRIGEDFEQLSQEFKLSGGDPESFAWIAGFYYYDSQLNGFNSVPIFEFNDGPDEIAAVAVPQAFATALSPIFGPLDEADITAEQTDARFDQAQDAIALFAQMSKVFWEDFTLVLGGRLSREEKEITYERVVSDPGLILGTLGTEEFVFNGTRTEQDFSPKVSLLYAFSDDVNGYATVARGYKAGGFSTAALNPDQVEFEREQADTIELGLKGRFWNGRIRSNIGLFQMKFKDLQVSNYNGTGFVLTNAAAATSRGIEMDGAILPIEGLMLGWSAGYIDATYDYYPNGVCPATNVIDGSGAQEGSCDLSGRPLALAPEYTASLTAALQLPLGNLPFGAMIGLTSSWQSDMFIDVDLDPLDLSPAHFLHDARVMLAALDGSWQASLIVHNLADEQVIVHSQDLPVFTGSHFGFIGPPRRATLSFEVRF